MEDESSNHTHTHTHTLPPHSFKYSYITISQLWLLIEYLHYYDNVSLFTPEPGIAL